MKILHFLGMATATVLLTSCNLDYPPTAAVSNETLTEEDYNALLNGVYDGAQGYRLVLEDVSADNLNSHSWYRDMDDNSLTAASDNINDLWEKLYNCIQRCNNLINLIDQKAQPTQAQIAQEAQAKVVRAWLYARVAANWGNAPLLTTVTDAKVPCASEDEIWQLVKSDLEFGVANAPEFSDAGRVSKVAAKALLARTLLVGSATVQDKTRAKQLAEEVIADSRFALATRYADIFQAKSSKEMILQWTNMEGDSGMYGWWLRSNIVDKYEGENGKGSAGYGEQGRYELPVDQALWNAYEAGDQRKEASVRHLRLANGTETYDCVKYPKRDNSDPWPVVRIAEMYLISAECDGYPQGVARLNTLRSARGLAALTAGTDITADNFMAKIMQERRVEFVAEGMRWYDLRRWFNSGATGKAAVLALRKYQPGETAGTRPSASERMNIDADGQRLLYPVPSVAINNDGNLLPNNPGY